MKRIVLDYAWKWFEYHASQRLIAFRFYMIIVGAFGWIFLRDGFPPKYPIPLGISLILVSVFFYILEERNNRLVDRGRDALDEFEDDNRLVDTAYAIRHNDGMSKESNEKSMIDDIISSKNRSIDNIIGSIGDILNLTKDLNPFEIIGKIFSKD